MNKYSFKDILEKEITVVNEKDEEKEILLDRIEIPKIQRDYAQGRPQESEVRKRFLDSIFNTLSNGKNMEMDFVYGSVDETTKVFTPLDGQQRLTTLFLLYWYVGIRELNDVDRKNLNKLLSKFTYETRTSSRDFCAKLTKIEETDNFIFEKRPSKEITNLSWFYKSYKQDPTIKAMLNMLDAIHERYGNEKQTLFDNLQNLQFYILPLNGFNLTDELYVKMNARGKQLTDFENFKADLIKWMKDDKNPENSKFEQKVELNGREMPYYLSISQKIDTTWTHFFWQETKNYENNPDGKIVDPLFMRLFYRYFLNKYILQSSTSDNRKMSEEDDYQTLYEETKYQNFDVFQKLVSHNNILKFEKFMDALQKNQSDILESIQPSWQKKYTFYDKEITQPERAVFLGIMLFLEKEEFDSVKFKRWMRIVWNIVENTDINGHAPMIGVMKLIAELADSASNIYDFLSDDNKLKSASSTNAVNEERQKAKFITNNPSWEEIFIDAEKHPFFRGSVGFIITDKMTPEEFKHRTAMAFSVFDGNGVNERYRKNGHVFLRALISRYTDHSEIVDRNYTDTDEREHYLKRMLASDKTVRTATQEWLSLKDEDELNKALSDAISKSSELQSNNELAQKKIRRSHEALYKTPDLQRWMQQNDAIRYAHRWDGHIYVSKPRGWYHWIMVDTNRNDIISWLLSESFTTKQQATYSKDRESRLIPYFWGYDIEVCGKVDKFEVKLTFLYDNKLTVEVKTENEEWKKIKTYDYVAEDEGLIDKLKSEILDENELKKLFP